MGRHERVKIIDRLQKARGTHVICYVTSTRPGFEVPMAMDAVRKVYEHLRPLVRGKGKEKQKIDLFLYSNGGDGTVPWRLVTLIREYADEFSVLVPHRAFSAATLTGLGADAVVMHPMGMLGPTDPTVSNAFNPDEPTRPGQKIGISVEDVTAFISLIKEDVGIRHEDELVQVFNQLATKIHPLALGNVKRSLSQSRMMARKLLSLHMKEKDDHKIGEIVNNLTSKLFYHGHPINRREAREQVGLTTVVDAKSGVEDMMWDLYLEYETTLRLNDPFNPVTEFLSKFPQLQPTVQGQPPSMQITPRSIAKLAYVESDNRTDVYELEYELSGFKNADGSTPVTTIVDRQGWATE